MSIFNFIETFFFISLGITFVLISLLVYHFRQRIIVLESKNDTMFEIINNIVKEVTNVRNSILYMNPSQMDLMQHANLMQQHFAENFDDTESRQRPIEHYIVEQDEDEDEDDNDNDNDNDEDDDEDEDQDEDEDEDEDEDDEDEDDEDEDNTEPQKIVVSLEPDEQPVKIVNVNVNIESTNLDIEEINDLATDEIASIEEEPIGDIDINADPVIVHKILDEIVNNVDSEITVEESKSKDVYRNMNTNQLKQLVITKGLSTNPSKLKKNELIQLLENVDL
jgi:cobalamin biosynthesis protein CobT